MSLWDTLEEDRHEEVTLRILDAVEERIDTGKPLDRDKILKRPYSNKAIKAFSMELYDFSRFPTYTVSSYMNFQRAVVREKRILNQERRRIGLAQGINVEEFIFLDESFEREKEKVMKDKGMWLGLDPFSQDWNIKLENRDEIKFAEFRKLIKSYGNNGKAIALPATVASLMTESTRKGLSRQQTAEVFVAFCKEFVTELTSTINDQFARGRYRDCYFTVVDRIDIFEEGQKIQDCLKKLTRKVGDNIKKTTGDLRNLCMQALEVNQPYSDETDRKISAGDFVLRYLRYFVNHETFAEYDKWLAKTTGQIHTTLERAVNELQRIEAMGDKYKITSERRLPKDLSMYEIHLRQNHNAEVNAVIPGKSPERTSRRDQWKKGKRKDKSGTRSRTPGSYNSSRNSSVSSGGYKSRSQSSTASVNPVQDSQTKYPGKEHERKPGYKPKSISPGGGSQKSSSQRNRSSTPRGPITCYRCGHAGHMGKDCFRYRSSTKTYCPKCKRQGRMLFHDPYYCNGSKSSGYRSPSAGTRDQRQKELKSKNGRPAQ